MSIANYTLPFIPPAPPAFVAPQTFEPVHPAAAINSLIFDTPRYSQTGQSYIPPSPNRRTNKNPRKLIDNRDPYRNQFPQKSQYQNQSPSQATTNKGADYDDYFVEPDYDAEKNDNTFKNYESQINKYREERPTNANTKTKRKLQNVPKPQQQSQPQPQEWPNHPPTYKQISNTFNSEPEPGAKTSIHAVLDFDDDFEDYSYEDDDVEPLPPSQQRTPKPQVTPIEGPIFIKNGSVPVVPLYSYPVVKNGSLVQIPVSILVN